MLKRNKTGFYLGLTAALLPAALVIALLDGKFYAWLALLVPAAALILLSRTALWKKGFRALFFTLAIILSLSGAYWGRPDFDVSFMGTLTRECVRFAVGLPFFRGGKITEYMKKLLPKDWSAPDDYSLTEIELENCRAELILADKSSENAIIYLHGGSFVTGNSVVFRNAALKLSKLGGAAVLLVDYRTAPEHTHPSALLDALDAWEYLTDSGFDPGNIILAGDSAGGNLALSLTALLRDENKELPRAIICMSPWADLAKKGQSYTYNYEIDPVFGKHSEDKHGGSMLTTIYAGDTSLCDSRLSPVYADFRGFPPMLLQTGSHEMLLSDSETIYKKAAESGVDVRLSVYHGMFHDFQLYGSYFPESKAAWNEIRNFISE
jgi:monoterpene epsilon-lactone hydrolase